MNRLIMMTLFLISPYIIWAQMFISGNDITAFVECNDGSQCVYRNINGITVGMANEEFKDDSMGDIIKLDFSIVGYMNIEHKKGKRLVISLNVGNSTFSYLWDLEKKNNKKNKKN